MKLGSPEEVAKLEQLAQRIIRNGGTFDTFRVAPGVATHFGLNDGDSIDLLDHVVVVRVDHAVPPLTGFLEVGESKFKIGERVQRKQHPMFTSPEVPGQVTEVAVVDGQTRYVVNYWGYHSEWISEDKLVVADF